MFWTKCLSPSSRSSYRVPRSRFWSTLWIALTIPSCSAREASYRKTRTKERAEKELTSFTKNILIRWIVLWTRWWRYFGSALFFLYFFFPLVRISEFWYEIFSSTCVRHANKSSFPTVRMHVVPTNKRRTYDAALIRIIYSKGEFSGTLVSGSQKNRSFLGDDISFSLPILWMCKLPHATTKWHILTLSDTTLFCPSSTSLWEINWILFLFYNLASP